MPHKKRLTVPDVLGERIPEDFVRRFNLQDPEAVHVNYFRQGNFTLALLMHGTQCVSFGISKRSVFDTERPVEAQRLALARSLRRVQVEKERTL